LALVVGLLLFPLVLGQSFWLRDMLVFAYPLKAYLRQRMLAGELALWNPRLGLGRPFLGVVQPGVLYPLNLALLLPYPRGVDLFFALHAFVAAFGARAWSRARGDSDTAALLAGALYALSGYYVSQLAGNGSFAVGAAWIPWALAAHARTISGAGAGTLAPRPAVAAVATCLALMVLAGDPQAAWFAGALLAAQALGAAGPGRGRAMGRALVVVLAASLLGAALAAAQLLPALEVASVGRPGGVSLAEASHWSFPPIRLVELVWPGAFGPYYAEDWPIHALYDEGSGVAYEPWSAGIYLGLATPLLALAALVRRRPRAADVALGVAAALLLVVAMGRHAPLFALFHDWVPGVRQFRYPEKYLLPVTLCLALLAARGFDVAVAHPRRALAVAVAAWLGLAAGAMASVHVGGQWVAHWLGRLPADHVVDAGRWVAARAHRSIFVATVLTLTLLSTVTRRLSPRTTALLLAAMMIADVGIESARLCDFAPSSLYTETPPPIVAARAIAGSGPLRLYRPSQLAFDAPGVPAQALLRGTLRPDCGLEDDVTQVDAYDNFPVTHEAALWTALEGRPLRLLQLTATRFALLPSALYRPQPGLGLVVVRQWPALHVLLAEVTPSPARVYLAGDARVADDEAAARILAASDFVPGVSVVLAPGAGAAVAHAGASVAHAAGECTLIADAPERLWLHCRSDAASFAVVADSWFPGWSARVDGRVAPIVRANLAMRAVPLPAGEHDVELVYRPAHLALGFVISAAALAFALALAASRRRAGQTASAEALQNGTGTVG
jgi:hypothetical protein